MSDPSMAAWLCDVIELTAPSDVVFCDGSEEERERLTALAVSQGVLVELDQQKLPGCHYHRSDPNDVARVEHLTFICTADKADAGPTNNWMSPKDACEKLEPLLRGSMKGRTMYVVPCLLGPEGSGSAKIGYQVTDSPYVVLSLQKMTRMGRVAVEKFDELKIYYGDDFFMGVHSTLDLDPEKRFICHFPESRTVWSVGSGYGGNALLPKKCFALRLASWQARKEGWLAEHMLLMEVERPDGVRKFVAAAFPSACGKTNFAMMIPPETYDGWKIRTIGDDIAWLRVASDGRLWAINPENGYFGVVPGTSMATNPNAFKAIQKDTIYTNVALTRDRNVWWEGKGEPTPLHMKDWRGDHWSRDKETTAPAAHPNSRFCTPMRNNPAFSPFADYPQGVPIDIIVFGGRRATTVPLVLESFDWTHGVFMGATLGSEKTAAAAGSVGDLRRDPMAMLPFCGYNIGDYFTHWLEIGKRLSKPPKIFTVNWFRKNAEGEFMWPGFGENMRVLEWMLRRADDPDQTDADRTPVGFVPGQGTVRLDGLSWDGDLESVMRVDAVEWLKELESVSTYFEGLMRDDARIPPALSALLELLHTEVTEDVP
jgi:phosphoenolpyruvate carboxykinase (GTP)